jgi:hypothetical protein
VSYSYNAKDFEGKIRTDDASFFGKFGNLREQMPMGSNPRRKESERRDDECVVVFVGESVSPTL